MKTIAITGASGFVGTNLTKYFENLNYKIIPISRDILNNNKKLEDTLKVIAVMFMILFLIVIIKGVFIPNLLTFVVALICFFTSLSFYVLAEVIKAAIKYKTEVDFTI